MSSFRTLHSFAVVLEKEITETSVREENGQKITVESKVKKPLDYTVLLKEPSRREKTELALFKDVTYGEAVKKGLIPKVLMQQILGKGDATNPLSENEDKNLEALNKRIADLANEYIRLNGNTSEPAEDTEERKARRAQVLQEWITLQNKAIDLNAAYQSVYASTAEHYTQTKMLTWLSLFLTYVKDPTLPSDSVPRPLFPGGDYAAKDAVLADLEDAQDPLLMKVLEKLPSYWMLYLFGRATTPEDFKNIEEDWAKEKALRDEAAKEKTDKKEVEPKTDPVAAPTEAVPPVDTPTV